MYKTLRIQIESYNLKLLNKTILTLKNKILVKFINDIKVLGPIYIPTKKRIYCVLTSPHVNKDAREHFELKRYKRIFILKSKTFSKIKQVLESCYIPAGVFIDLK